MTFVIDGDDLDARHYGLICQEFDDHQRIYTKPGSNRPEVIEVLGKDVGIGFVLRPVNIAATLFGKDCALYDLLDWKYHHRYYSDARAGQLRGLLERGAVLYFPALFVTFLLKLTVPFFQEMRFPYYLSLNVVIMAPALALLLSYLYSLYRKSKRQLRKQIARHKINRFVIGLSKAKGHECVKDMLLALTRANSAGVAEEATIAYKKFSSNS